MILVRDPVTGKMVSMTKAQLDAQAPKKRAETPTSPASSRTASPSPLSSPRSTSSPFSEDVKASARVAVRGVAAAAPREESLFDKVSKLNTMQWNLIVEKLTGRETGPVKPKTERALAKLISSRTSLMSAREAEKFVSDLTTFVERSAKNAAVAAPKRPVTSHGRHASRGLE